MLLCNGQRRLCYHSTLGIARDRSLGDSFWAAVGVRNSKGINGKPCAIFGRGGERTARAIWPFDRSRRDHLVTIDVDGGQLVGARLGPFYQAGVGYSGPPIGTGPPGPIPPGPGGADATLPRSS